MDERNRDFAGMAAAVRRLAEESPKRQERESQSAYDQQIDELSKILTSLYDKTAAYTSLIIIAGYAGFFTVWSNVRNELTKEEMVYSAVAMSVSLMFFVLWEAVKIVITTLKLQSLRREVLTAPPEALLSKLQKVRRSEANLTLRLGYCWMLVLVVVLVFGLAAAAILLNAFLRQLIY